MAKPCKITTTDPKSGKTIDSLLGEELARNFPNKSLSEIQDLLAELLSKDFYNWFGGVFWKPEGQKQLKNKIDEQNWPRIEYALRYKEEVLDKRKFKKRFYQKETEDNINIKKKYIQASLDTILQQISAVKRTRGKEGKTETLANLKILEKLLEKAAKDESHAGFLTFLQNAAEYSDKILKAFDVIGTIDQKSWAKKETRDNFQFLVKDMYDFIMSYGSTAMDILGDYNTQDKNAEGLDLIETEELEYLKQIANASDLIKSKYKTVAQNIIGHELGSYFKGVENEYRKDFEKEFEEKNPIKGWKDSRTAKYTLDGEKVNKDEYLAAQEKYILEEIAKIKNKIYNETVEYIKGDLEASQMDIDTLPSWISGISRQSDAILQLVGEKFDIVDDKLRLDFLKVAQDIKPFYDAFVEQRTKELGGVKITKGAEINDPFLEESREEKGKYTKHLVTEFHSDYYKLERQMFDDTAELPIKERKKKRKAWYKKNKDGKNPGDQWRNEKYVKLVARGESDPTYIFYKKLVEIQKEADKRVSGRHKLGSKLYQTRKGASERITTEGKDIKSFAKAIYMSLKEGFKNTLLVREEDEARGLEAQLGRDEDIIVDVPEAREKAKTIEVETDIDGSPRRFIPVHGRLSVPDEEMSYNVLDLVLANYYVSSKYSEYNNILPEIKMIEEFMKTRAVNLNDGFKKILSKAKRYHKEILLQDAKNPGISNSYQTLATFIDQRVYGISTLGAMSKSFIVPFTKDEYIVDTQKGEIKVVKAPEIPVNKLVSAISAYTGAVLLQFNWMASGANLLFGQSMSMFESIGGHYFGKRDLAIAYWYMNKDMLNIANDIGKVLPTSLTGLILQKYDALNEFHPNKYNFEHTTKARNIVKPDSLWFTISLPEYANHGIPVLAHLQNIKVLDKDGNYLLKGEGTTTDVNKALSLLDSHSIGTDGQLVIDKRVKSTTKDGKTDPREEDFISRQIVRPLQLLNEDFHGQYANNNKMRFQFTWYGSFVRAMRGFFVPVLRKRWKGVSKIVSEQEPTLNDFQQGKNVTTDGDYTTSVLFLKKLLKDLDKFKFRLGSLTKKEWNNLNSYERAQIRRSIFEIGMAGILGVMGKIFKAAGEEDDELHHYFLAFYASRLHTELTAFYNPVEFMRILKSPAVSMTMIERVIRLWDQILEDSAGGEFERYVSGRKKGQTKIKYRLRDITPWWKQFERHKDIAEAVEYYYRNSIW